MDGWPSFEQPGWLVLLIAAPLLAAWWFRRKPLAVRFPETGPAVAMNSRRGAVARWSGVVLRWLALSALVIALANPRWPDPGSRIPTQGIAILLVVDVSNSMNEEDFLWDGRPMARIKAMKRAFRLFLAGGTGPGGEQLSPRKNDLVGLVTFTRRPKLSCPLTLSHGALLDILEREETNKSGHDFETNIGDAIAWGLDKLESAPVKHRVMVLVTDGEQGEIPKALRPKQAAQLASHFGIPILVIDPGNDAVTMSKTPADQLAAENRLKAKKTMAEVAKMTGGQYYGANDTKTLFEGLTQMSDELDRPEREGIETFRYRKYLEGYAWLAGTAFVLCWAVVALELTVWRRVP